MKPPDAYWLDLKSDYAAERSKDVARNVVLTRYVGAAVGVLYLLVWGVPPEVPLPAMLGLVVLTVCNGALVEFSLRRSADNHFWPLWGAAAVDIFVLLVWIGLTGASASVFTPLIYVALVSGALQHGAPGAILGGLSYGLGLTLVNFVFGDFAALLPHLVLVLACIAAVTVISSALAREAFREGNERIAVGDREKRFRAIFEGSLDLVSLHEPESGRYIEVNRQFRKAIGFRREEMIGKTARELGIWDDPAARRATMAALSRGEGFWNHETDFLTKDGTRRRGLYSVVPLELDGEKIVASFMRDVTELEAAKAELAAAERRAATTEKLRALGTLVSGVAHEIRTPSTSATNHLFLLRERVGALCPVGAAATECDDVVRHADQAIEALQRIDRLVEDLRQLSRGESKAELEVRDVVEVVRSAADLFEATHRGQNTLVRDFPPSAQAAVDSLPLQQVVLNLLANASEASESGSEVTLSLRSQGSGTELRVADRGNGIDAAAGARLFDPFFTTKDEGTGLGLSITREIVERHGGTLRYEARPGGGTTFVVVLPAVGSDPLSSPS